MNKWKDIVEILALLTVVASLLVVVIELRQTQVALQSQAYQARSFQSFDHHIDMMDKPELDALFRESWSSDFRLEKLSSVERQKLERLYMALRADYDNEHYQYQQGFLDPDFYLATTARDIKTFAPVWRTLGIDDSRALFHAEVDRILSDASVVSWVETAHE